jgi:signal transduction histidine kinase
MSGRSGAGTRQVAAWLIPGLALVAWIGAEVLLYVPTPAQPSRPAIYGLYGLPYVAFAAVAGLIIRSRRASPVGWVLGWIGLLQGLDLLATELLSRLATTPRGSDVAGWALAVLAPVPIATTGLIVVLLLVFPDGRLPSPRWRWFLAAIGVLLLAVLVTQLTDPAPPNDVPGLPASPLAARAVHDALAPFVPFWTFPVAVLVAGWSLVQRYRAGGAVVRSQIKWLALSTVVLALCEAGNIALGDAVLAGVLDVVGKLAVVAAIGIAVLRHRLYDVDRAISRALAYGWLAVLVTGIYVLLVVGVGSALGHPAGPDLMLSLVATIVVALVSLPLRLRLQEGANRLVYGRRQAPYEFLAGFTRRLAERSEGGDPVPEIARALGEGLRARAAAVYLREQGEPAASGTWPPGAAPPDVAPTGSAPITHQGEHLGRLEVWTDSELTDAEGRLLEDLAQQAGLVIRNAALSTELQHRLTELRASRLRLVAAQDAERRRFERDLHDGAQQELLTVRMKLGSAERLVEGLPAVADLLREVQESTAMTLDSMRRLSRGLNPPLLQSHGLVPALVAHARRLPLPTEVRGNGGRFPADVETAVYFCCAEALQNVVKHAGALRAWVTVNGEPDRVCFVVGDDGCGLGAGDQAPGSGSGSGLQNMADRLEALGGRLDVRWDAEGTRVIGTVPLPRAGDPPATAVRPEAGRGMSPAVASVDTGG